MERAKYILIEGGEGCGKSTQAKLLEQYLLEKNIPVKRCREPGTSKKAEQIRKFLKNPKNNLSPEQEVDLFMQARQDFFKQEIIPNLEQGISIIADRSGYSTIAYQGYAGGVSLNLIRKLNNQATFGTKEDLAIIIDIEATKGLEKESQKDRISLKGLKYHQRVNQGYREICKQNPEIIKIPYIEGDLKWMQEQIRKYANKLFNL